MNARLLTFALTAIACVPYGRTEAASPGSVQQGQVLFERNWPSRNPEFGSDGLGPLFNARSCVACHHQGGVGGGGDSRFNALSIGIESMTFTGDSGSPSRRRRAVANSRKSSLLNSFYPAFIQAGSVVNSAALPHHGATELFSNLRSQILSNSNAQFSVEGGSVNAQEVRLSSDTPIHYINRIGPATINLRARLFQRNTTSLFGAGLIDTIPESAVKKQMRIQERHPEISGRPSLLRDGRFGRFGWRANSSSLVGFVDRACANELSLETKRRPQAADPGQPLYRNPSIDIEDAHIESISDFIAALPRPVEIMPANPTERERANRGRIVFETIGCAVCHTPNLGGVPGVYSDLLLHDMGPYLFDFEAAEPYVVSQTLSKDSRPIAGTEAVSYYGKAGVMGTGLQIPDRYVSPRGSNLSEDFVTVATGQRLGRFAAPQASNITGGSGRTVEYREEIGLRRKLKPSNTTQEWRTPPLWGVRDSAPYMHDGRAETLLEAIVLHDGEAAATRDRFLNLSLADRLGVIALLETFVAPPDAPKPRL